MQRRKSGIYEFRQRLPSTLAGKVAPPQLRTVVPELINPKTGLFKRELVASLQTHDAATAKRKNLKEALRASRLFDHAAQLMASAASPAQRPGPVLSPAEIEEEVYRSVLAGDEEERELGDARRYHQTRAEREQWPDLADAKLGQRGMAAGHLELLGDLNTEDLESYRRAWAQRDMEPVRGELHAFLTKRGLPIDPTSAGYREAGLALLRGRVRAHEAIAQRQAGGIVETPQSAPAARGPKLSEAFAMWKNGTQARGGKKPTAMTVREAERAIRYFTDYHGDLRLGDISKELARDFRNALSRLPTRLTVPQRKMGLRALLRDADTSGQEPIHAASVNKYLNILVAIVSAAEREGVMDKVAGFTNPFSRLGLTIDKRNDPNRRMPFNEAQLYALFTTGVFKAAERPRGGSGEAAYWLPLIALLSGARLNEIAQLRLVDLARDPETGIWFIDIGTEGGRAIKTATSRRRVPVHAELIRLGLLRYREAALKAAGGKQDAPLWPELGSAHDTYRSTAWSKWFNRYLRVTANITDSALVFHSFRHTFKRRARDAGVSEELSDALTGHGGEASIGRSYGAGFGLKALHEAVGRIEAPDAIKALPEWRPGKARENGGSNAAG